MTGISDAGIPVVAKAVMNTGSLLDLQPLVQAGQPGYLIWRMDRFPDGSDDVPRYGVPVDQEAARYMQAIIQQFPQELDKSRVYVEVINEPDRNQLDYLGRLGKALGQLAITNGFKIILFGFNSGEPEPLAWEEPGMLEFMHFASQNIGNVAISLHEYSFNRDIHNIEPYLVGRFQFLLDVLENYNIRS